MVGPLGMALSVGIEVGDDLTGRGLEAGVSSSSEALMGELDHLDRVPAGQGEGFVGGAVVAADDLQRWVVAGHHRREAAINVRRHVVAADHDGDCRPPGPQTGQIAFGPFGDSV